MQGIFKNDWKWFVSSLCLGLLREKGTTVQKFFPDVLKSVYSLCLRLKGEQHLEGYNFQRTMDELIERLNEKEKEEEEEVEKEEEEKEVEQAEKRRKLDENESDETRLVRKLELSKHLSLGALQSMYMDAQSPIIQLIGKNVEGSQHRSVTLSDGWTIGHTVPTSSS